MRLGDMVRISEDKNKTRALMNPTHPDFGKITKNILDFIDAHPGTTYREMFNARVANEATLSSTLNRLKKNGQLKMRYQDFLNRYYPKSYLFSNEINKKTEEINKMSVHHGSLGKKILAHIKAHPGSTSKQMALEFGIKDPSSVNRHLKIFRSKGAVIAKTEKRGRRSIWTYFPKNYQKPFSLDDEVIPGTHEALDKLTIIQPAGGREPSPEQQPAFNEFKTRVGDFLMMRLVAGATGEVYLKDFIKYIEEHK